MELFGEVAIVCLGGLSLPQKGCPNAPFYMYKYFDQLFSMHVNPKTKELLNPHMIRPFSLAAKLKNETKDYPSFKEILKMLHHERAKWFDSMDQELCALFKSGTCKFVNWDKVLKQVLE